MSSETPAAKWPGGWPATTVSSARPEPVRGTVQGAELVQYDYTPEQYRALARLTATLCKVFPKMRCDYPRDAAGQLVLRKLPDDDLDRFSGLLGHWNVQTNKVDPGPAFQWDWLLTQARKLMRYGFAPRFEKQAAALLDFVATK